jgi:uncharacterized membrane protein YphA (DoxX/SURF4 family)
VAFRFVFAYAALRLVPFPLSLLPGEAISSAVGRLHAAVVTWTGAHVLHLAAPIATARTGSGDRMFDWVRCLVDLAVAVIAAAAWSALDRRRREYARLFDWLRVGVRYYLASMLVYYGMAKVAPIQFSPPTAERLIERFGEASPMGLLWTFMGFSRAYSVFTGAAEVVAGLLLFFRRTTTLGALVGAVVMANVAMLNFCYDVPVKLDSTHYLAGCIFLLAPDLRRLAGVLVLNRPVEAASLAWPPMAPWARRARLAVKGIVLVIVAYQQIQVARSVAAQRSKVPTAALAGAYEVEELEGAARPAWRSLTLYPWGYAKVRRADPSARDYAAKEDLQGGTLTLSAKDGSGARSTLSFQREGDVLAVEGTFEGASVRARLRRLDESRWLLVSRGFHWVSEAPYNR